MPLSPKPDRAEQAAANPRDFEATYAELQKVVDQLEDVSLDLEGTLRLFERANELAAVCEGIVDAAELRVTRLAAETASPLSDVPPTA